MVGAATLETVTPLPVRSAAEVVVASQLAAAARLKVVAPTDAVPLLFKTPFTASLSAVFKVMLNAVLLLAVTLALVSV